MKTKITARKVAGLKRESTPYELWDTELAGFGIRVLPTGAASYSVRYRTPDGKRKRLRLGDARVLSVAKARRLAHARLSEVAQGEDPALKKRRDQDMPTVGEFIENDFRTRYLAHQKGGRAAFDRLRSCFKADFWDRRLDDPGLGFLFEKWRAKRVKEGLTHSSANRYFAGLRIVFSQAAQWGFIEDNPLRRVRNLKVSKTPRVRYLSPDEASRLQDALGRCPDYLRVAVVVSLNTGLRNGELFAMEWRDVDFDRGILTVRGEVTKTGRSRHVPMNATVQDALQAWKEQGPGEGLVFPGRFGQRRPNATQRWLQLLEDAGITGFRWHDMRHDFASKLVMAGVDLNTVRELLGHSDIGMTLRYAHLSPKVKAEAVARLDVKRRENVGALDTARSE